MSLYRRFEVKKMLVTIVLVTFAGFMGWRIFSPAAPAPGPGTSQAARAIPVEVTPVRHDTIRDIARFTGTLVASSRFVVSPKIPGRLEKLQVNIGDRVDNGDLIAVLDSEEYALAVTQAEAELEVSRANLADAKSALELVSRDLERTRELQLQKVASEAELDSMQAKYNAANAAFEVAGSHILQREAALEAAKVRLAYARIHARWAGSTGGAHFVSEKFIDEGNMLRANDPIVSIVDIGSVIARINVIERDFPAIRVGQSAIVSTDAYPGMTFEGRVVRRSPVLAEASRQALVEIEIPNTDLLLAPGMYIRSSIEFARKPDATIIPASAIVSRDARKGVFLADKNTSTAVFVPIETGITEGEDVEVLSPDISGLVISLGQHLLEDGSAIRVTGAGKESGN
jgi:RND family efflux transporter MFP subunit